MSLAFCSNLMGQSGTSTLRGTITDQQGKIIAGATVTLKSEGKSSTRTQVSNSDGQFVFTAIPPDSYNLVIVY